MFLQEPEADAILGPVCCKASGFAGIEDPYTFFDLASNNSFGLVVKIGNPLRGGRRKKTVIINKISLFVMESAV